MTASSMPLFGVTRPTLIQRGRRQRRGRRGRCARHGRRGGHGPTRRRQRRRGRHHGGVREPCGRQLGRIATHRTSPETKRLISVPLSRPTTQTLRAKAMPPIASPPAA